MYNTVIDHPDMCYGCGACVAVCPQNCLELVKDEMGFKTVHVSNVNACISCGECSRVCEALKMISGTEYQMKRYYAQNKDKDVLMRSSSGGVFSALAEYVFQNHGFVWGVQMNENGKNEFQCVSNSNDLKKLCGSKYVEVDTDLPFLEVKKQAISGVMVLFSGTPCQIQAMRQYLKNKRYDNLILVDLLCYGVQSPVMWKKYLSEINPHRMKLKNVQMRYKKPSWENYGMRVEFEDGTFYRKGRWKDPYLLSYAANLYNREVCSQCQAKAFPRASDITLGDFWQIDTLPSIPRSISVDSGVSIVLVHSNKGTAVLKALDTYLNIYELPSNVFPNMIERFSGCSRPNHNKEYFLQQVNDETFSAAVRNNTENQLYGRLRFKWLKIKRIIKRIIR